MDIEKLIALIKTYNAEEENIIRKAYEYARLMHAGQRRQSGEPYIIHPLNVAYILAQMKADRDTICAGLLHDTLEDTKATKEEISNLFNPCVSELVDGVTKLSKMNFSSKKEEVCANTKKIISGITEDIRIIIIKLADRLHNMRTLQYKSVYKQKENAIETLELFVPLAYSIGAYRIKNELEDLSFQYLKPDKYKEIKEVKERVENESKDSLIQMLYNIKGLLEQEQIKNCINLRTKNIYGIYKRLEHNETIFEIHDLFALKILVNEIRDCYVSLGLVHKLYNPINSRFKDYIWNPKTNMYRSLHTTVFGPDDKLVQTQIRTFDMEAINSFGLTAYWDLKKGEARNVMQNDLKQKFQFYQSLEKISSKFKDNEEFVKQVKEEILSKKVYVYTPIGTVVEMPESSTIADYAYKLNVGKIMKGAFVNDEPVPYNYVLKNKDRVKIITEELSYNSKTMLFKNAYILARKKQTD